MTAFEDFPYDVIFELSKFLSLDDVVHLSQTCRQLRASIFIDDKLARKVVRAHHSYTNETVEARRKITTYREALCAIYERRHAFSNAKPFAAQVIGQGNAFLYRCGVLCVQQNSIITVMNLRSAVPRVQFDIGQLLFDRGDYHFGDTYEMMYYSDDILALLVTSYNENGRNERDSQGSFIVPIRTTKGVPDGERIIRMVGPIALGPVTGSVKLFVRHTSEYMYFGLHNGQGRDGHRKWMIEGCSLDWKKRDNEIGRNSPLLIEDFHGNDVGSTVAFEIHDGYFYAVSNQGTYEVEEVDWTSFYHCVRFPLNNNVEEALQRDTRVYRRQHAEGAIHDSWTDLTLQRDERTNDLYIVESRREWLGATSKQARTFYTSRIHFSAMALVDSTTDVGSSNNTTVQPLPLPDDDILTSLLDSSHKAHYMPTPDQYSWTQHPEFPASLSLNKIPRSFILAKTKFRAYNYSCSTYVDLVEDDNCCSNRPPNSRPCLRLRMGSRRTAPSGVITFGHEDENRAAECDVTPNDCSGGRKPYVDNTRYRYSEINMWPPPPSTCPCSARLHRIMNPVFRSNSTWGGGGMQAVSDERSIVYMVKPSDTHHYADGRQVEGALGTIVLVDFGRSHSSLQTSSDLRWERGASQEEKCRSGTCG